MILEVMQTNPEHTAWSLSKSKAWSSLKGFWKGNLLNLQRSMDMETKS